VCEKAERICVTCGKTFVGRPKYCVSCLTPAKVCETCERVFNGLRKICPSCLAIERKCLSCGKPIKNIHLYCGGCQRKKLPAEIQAARQRRSNNARRARLQAAQIAGPLPASAYIDVVNSGPCVYCGNEPTTVDHIRPLAKGGFEIVTNLVPACRSCNFSKGARLLIEWGRINLVLHAISKSQAVAAEYAREMAERTVSNV
jgi:5-methylcytosine-specific restriction endonuclease McrA